jgi:hypothetical protein
MTWHGPRQFSPPPPLAPARASCYRGNTLEIHMSNHPHPVSALAFTPSDGSTPPNGVARCLGDLARDGISWRVHLETRSLPHPGGFLRQMVKGRLHFVSGARSRSTAWLFVEHSEPELVARFHEFSPGELWRLMESLPTEAASE